MNDLRGRNDSEAGAHTAREAPAGMSPNLLPPPSPPARHVDTEHVEAAHSVQQAQGGGCRRSVHLAPGGVDGSSDPQVLAGPALHL